jgi:hypothetical protein
VFSAGQLLTADSLRLGQRYVEQRLALRRFVDGIGVVCGMHVRCAPEEPGWVIVEPGHAVDCCGHDIVICDPVRFNLCKAIAECPQPAEPCADVPPPEEPQPQGPTQLDPVSPGDRNVMQPRVAVVAGRVFDAVTSVGIAGAQVSVGNFQALTDPSGKYQMVVTGGTGALVELDGRAGAAGYLTAVRKVGVQHYHTTVADWPLTPVKQPAPPPPEFFRYILRVEGTWEGRAPVPVVTSRGACDPRPECRPSKEVGSVRLCVEPLVERAPEGVIADRTKAFQEDWRRIFARLADAIDATAQTAPTTRDPDPPGRAIADALLIWMRERPLRTSCNLLDYVCDLRRKLKGDPPLCFPLDDVNANDGLVDVVGRIIDDFREDYLTRGCEDCCERVGVRLAHVWTQRLGDECRHSGCSIAGIDTHVPSREALHPRSAWWYPHRVAVYDAYFRGSHEAGVLLTDRGLTVRVADVGSATNATPTGLPAGVQTWITNNGGDPELKRIALYQDSILYVPYSAAVTLWTVGDRVIAITQTVQKTGAAKAMMVTGAVQPYFARLPGHRIALLAPKASATAAAKVRAKTEPGRRP